MRTIFVSLFGVLLFGCSSRHATNVHLEEMEHGAVALSGQGLGARGRGLGGGGFGRVGGSKAKKSAPAPAPYSARLDMAEAEGGVSSDGGVDTDSSPARMVHYNGHVQLEVSRPDETITLVVERVKELGGYVERRTQSSVSLRVPVAEFRGTYDWVMGQGDVLSRSMSARDVTDAHFAMQLRMRTAKKTRDRLQVLLARAEDENTKLALLKQIQRLTEQVDSMERQLKTLASLASMSRLTVEAKSRAAMVGRQGAIPIDGFGWIGRLSPFSRSVAEEGDELELSTPEGLVALSDQDHFQAESSDGVILWTARLDNQPQGSASFWLEAVKERIGEEFASAEEGKVGEYLTLRLVAPSEEPYTYTLALRVEGDELHLVEIYYPTAEAEQRHRKQIEAVLGGGAS